MMDLAQLVIDLRTDEGWRGYLYDDANDAPIRSGSYVRGHPTAGYGFALDVAPLTQDEALPILRGRVSKVAAELLTTLAWTANLSEPRQRALANMAYQNGVDGLLKFTTFLGLLQMQKFEEAATDLEENTQWYKDSGSRAARIAALIRNG